MKKLCIFLALALALTAAAFAADNTQKTLPDGDETLFVYLVGGEEFAVSEDRKIEFETRNPDAVPVMVPVDGSEPTAAVFRNLTVTEELIAAVRKPGQSAQITLDRCDFEGVIEPAARSGGLFGGKAASPVSLTMENGSVWTVTGTSTLSKLTLDRSSRLEGAAMTVDGKPAEIEAGVFEGEIVLAPAGKTLSAVEIGGEAYVTLESLLEAMK